MMFCLGATIGRRIGDPYLMRHLAAKSADLMLVNLPHWKDFPHFVVFVYLLRNQEMWKYLIFCSVLPEAPKMACAFSPDLSHS
jgi:hypothetical protein